MSNFDEVFHSAMNEIDSCENIKNLEKVRIKYFGKNGIINLQMRKISTLSNDKKKVVGKKLNIFKQEFSESFNNKKTNFQEAELLKKIELEYSDPTMPSRYENFDDAKIHPITQTTEEIISILGTMGLKLVEGPDVEDEFHNFTALNIPENHPARQMHDTFYLEKSEKNNINVLRTHTSPVQIREMKQSKLPIKIFAPGRTYRCDSDITHTPMFHQVEGLVIDENVSFANLKWFISQFCKIFFDRNDLKLRFRPSFFPFTEPSAEVDINCSFKENKLVLGEGDNWLEILGCGMVHPNVFEYCNLSSKKISGFAFGMGIERITMLKNGIPDLRDFFDNDKRWLSHYGFNFFDIPDLNWK